MTIIHYVCDFHLLIRFYVISDFLHTERKTWEHRIALDEVMFLISFLSAGFATNVSAVREQFQVVSSDIAKI